MSLVIPFAVFCVALGSALLLTPLVRSLAHKFELVDRPDSLRKIHAKPIALGGGVAVLAATFLATGVFIPGVFQKLLQLNRPDLLGLGGGVLLLCGIGLLDDAKGIRARQKLFGQILACLVVVASGLVIHSIDIFGMHIELGIMAWPFTMFWLLGAINAINLIDGADGLATTVSIILVGALAIMATMGASGNISPDAVVAFALLGSLIGFLRYNFPPASIFLGDAGSMTIGLLIGSLAVRTSLKGPTTFALAAPLAILAVPALDCVVAILRRRLTGRSIATTDRGHLHHCILRRGADSRQLLLWVALLCGTSAAGALLGMYFHAEWIAVVGVAIVVVSLVATRTFGHAEFLLVASRLRSLSSSIVTPTWQQSTEPHSSIVQLQGSRRWDILWQMLTEAAANQGFSRVRLNLNLPWLHESYHADWHQQGSYDPNTVWHTDVPLIIEGRNVGRLRISSKAELGQVAAQLDCFAVLLEEVEQQLLALMSEPATLALAADNDAPTLQRSPPESDGSSDTKAVRSA